MLSNYHHWEPQCWDHQVQICRRWVDPVRPTWTCARFVHRSWCPREDPVPSRWNCASQLCWPSSSRDPLKTNRQTHNVTNWNKKRSTGLVARALARSPQGNERRSNISHSRRKKALLLRRQPLYRNLWGSAWKIHSRQKEKAYSLSTFALCNFHLAQLGAGGEIIRRAPLFSAAVGCTRS